MATGVFERFQMRIRQAIKVMSSLKEIESAVARLSPEELARFRSWFANFDADAWDRQFKVDAAAGRLDALADEALRDLDEALPRAMSHRRHPKFWTMLLACIVCLSCRLCPGQTPSSETNFSPEVSAFFRKEQQIFGSKLTWYSPEALYRCWVIPARQIDHWRTSMLNGGPVNGRDTA